MSDTPKKISPDQVEIIGANGEVVKPAHDTHTTEGAFQGTFGGMRVMKVGPWALLLLPVLIPIMIIGFFIIMLLAMVFGKTMFKVLKNPIIRNPRG